MTLGLRPAQRRLQHHHLLGVERLAPQDALQSLSVDVTEPLGAERELGLRVDHLPAALREVGLLEQAALREQDAGVSRAQAGLQEVDASTGQVGNNVFFGGVQRGENSVCTQVDLITVDIPDNRAQTIL